MYEHIRESNPIEGISDEREITQSLVAWKFLLDQPDLGHAVVQETQHLIVANQPGLRGDERGAYRDVSRVNVTVGAYRPPPWQDVPDLMADWLAEVPNRTPWWNHVYFEGIHPFVDGNGRTGRNRGPCW